MAAPACHKVPYVSRAEASAALADQRGKIAVCAYYLCWCGAWHLTSRPYDRRRRARGQSSRGRAVR